MSRPLTQSLLSRIRRILKQKKISRAQLGRDIGKTRQEISEYLNGWRSMPNAETALRLLQWADEKETKKQKTK